MRRITLWSLSTITILVLLFSYRTSLSTAAGSSVAVGAIDSGSGANGPTSAQQAQPSPQATRPSPAEAHTTPTGPDAKSGATTKSKPARPSPTNTPRAARSYVGSVVNTNYGPVQVKITVVGGRVTKSVAAQVPWSGRRDQEINAQAVPILNAEAVRAQSAAIDMVSGATYTSGGYIHSLQAALDRAHL